MQKKEKFQREQTKEVMNYATDEIRKVSICSEKAVQSLSLLVDKNAHLVAQNLSTFKTQSANSIASLRETLQHKYWTDEKIKEHVRKAVEDS